MKISHKEKKLTRPSGCSSSSGAVVNGSGNACAADSLSVNDKKQALPQDLMERICSHANLNSAFRRVKSNAGAAGIDRMSVDELHQWLTTNKEGLIASLLEGKFMPGVVRGVDIPKPGGGKRLLGIPTVVDRLVQQAISQILTPILEPVFSDSSYGFRPGRSARDAVLQAKGYVESGFEYVVDIDLESYFDRVNHDILMDRLTRHVGDRRLLKLVRRFLQAGMMREGILVTRSEGTPQGGPLSPLLANLLLDDLDKELEFRGHKFCRYADDCNVYVRSQKAADRILASLTEWLSRKLKLRINAAKSGAMQSEKRKFLGYRITPYGLVIAPESVSRIKGKIRTILARRSPVSAQDRITLINQLVVGWTQYFRHAKARTLLHAIDKWVRRRFRCLILHQCKRAYTRMRLLRKYGVPEWRAWITALSGKGMWRMSRAPSVHEALSKQLFTDRGLKSFEMRFLELNT